MLIRIVLIILILKYNFINVSSRKAKERRYYHQIVSNKLEMRYGNQTKVFHHTPRSLISGLEGLATATFQNFKSIADIATNPLKMLIERTFPIGIIKRYFKLPEMLKNPMCILCKVVAQFIFFIGRTDINKNSLKDFLYFICRLAVHYMAYIVCAKSVDIHFDVIRYILLNKRDLTAIQACAIGLQAYGCFKEARVKFDMPAPAIATNRQNPSGRSKAQPFSVLQVTDIHLDPLYKPSATINCGRPLCCQADNAMSTQGAGKWGAYGSCNMPWYAFESFLDSVVAKNDGKQSSFSYVYFTGDIISHRVWETSEKSNIEEIRRLYRIMKEKLGSIRVFPVIGNHEPHPVNVFHPPGLTGFSTQWLFDVLAEEWSVWLPESALATVRKGGHYSVLVEPGFRIISLNSNVCSTFNWWIMYDANDPFDQLKWLTKELEEAEKNHEAVHLLSHCPPGEEGCYIPWSIQFRRIVERFSNTIVAQFNGHTHFDELKVFYHSSNLSHPINVAFNGGSFVTFIDVNPNYRIYDIDPTSLEVTDYHEFIYQIPIANFFPNNTPVWYKLFSFKKAYRLPDLSLRSLDDLVHRMAKDETLLQRFYRFKVRDSEPLMTIGCDKNCMKDNLCSIVMTVYDDRSKCEELFQYNYADIKDD